MGDSYSYWVLAEHIAAGEPYQYGSENASIFRAPLYPLLLAPISMLGSDDHSIFAARFVGCLLGTLAVGLIFALANSLGGRLAGTAAAICAAVYPSAIGMSIMVLSEAIFLPLMILHLLFWRRAWQSNHTHQTTFLACSGGIIAGLAVLARPSWLLFLPFTFCVGILLGPDRIRHVKIFVASIIGLAIVMSPWWVRNGNITGRFVPTTLQVGPSLYDGLHAGATGASDEGMLFMKQFFHEQLDADLKSTVPLESTFEWRLNQRASKAAVDWTFHNPLQAARLALTKFALTWNLWPKNKRGTDRMMHLVISFASYGILLLAIAWTYRETAIRDWSIWICWIPCIYFTCLHMVFVGSIRYREPAVFALCALAGCAIARFIFKKHEIKTESKPRRSGPPNNQSTTQRTASE